MKKIALIYMGGTFGCIGEPLQPMPAEDFIPKLTHVLPIHLDIECFIAPVIKDSSACTAEDWLLLIQQIQQLQLQQFQHFVVIHGTDTLSYASAVAAHFIADSARVVFTGSQYPLLNVQGTDTREFSDAISNLNFALDAVMKHPVGVYLAFHQQVLHAQTALKRHTTELDAFTGVMAEQPIPHSLKTHIVQTGDVEQSHQFNCLNLMMQPVALAQQLQNLKNLLTAPPHFLILQGFGTGNLAVNAELIALFDEFYAQGCIVILSTQVPFGRTDQRYAVAAWTTQAKIIVSDCLGHADLYAKALKMYLQYPTAEARFSHWHDLG